MAKYMILGSEPDEDRWRLDDDANVAEIQARIEGAMASGATARIPVIVDGRAAELIVNGRVLDAALAWEAGASEPTFAIID